MVGRVKIYQPSVSVTLYKTISRTTLDNGTPVSQRFQGTAHTIDLTPFLGENSVLRTSKSVREAAGGFSLTLADKPYKGNYAGATTLESLYGLVEPMDFIEIRMRHDPPSSQGQKPTIIMRGFVSEITRSESMGSDGRPQRFVIINGQDYGKLWQMLQIIYLPGYVIGEDIISGFKLFERFGGAVNILKSADFVTQIIQTILNPYLANLMPSNSPNPATIQLDMTVSHGVTSIQGPQNQEGSIYNLLRTYGDVGIWNELYLDDREDGVYCVYRPVPALDASGNLIQSDAPNPVYWDLPDTDVISLNVSRSDANVANYYWVRAPRFDLVDSLYQQQFAIQGAAADTVLLGTYANSSSNLYGTRVMYGETQQGGDEVGSMASGLPKAQQATRNASMANWTADRRAIMVNQNKDNVLFERGAIRVRGNENIKAGMYVRLRRGQFRSSYYVVQVDHEFIPFQGFFSTLIVERGTGFIERAKRNGSGGDSPYLAEMAPTPSLSDLVSSGNG
jgi:hypothetical protein